VGGVATTRHRWVRSWPSRLVILEGHGTVDLGILSQRTNLFYITFCTVWKMRLSAANCVCSCTGFWPNSWGLTPAGPDPYQSSALELAGYFQDTCVHLPHSKPWLRYWCDSMRSRVCIGDGPDALHSPLSFEFICKKLQAMMGRSMVEKQSQHNVERISAVYFCCLAYKRDIVVHESLARSQIYCLPQQPYQ